ncbi:MAG: WbqC family protein [Candidatus Tectomicrobia bacterium]|uniref:WbqC family protein n=1 Tax=Tectimicrobiota bacterium TaxID=2528274 RepID=A0A932CQ64_UNCTE|nr:WbqC family protein [Candidatus Tectomicrobia bacterium]
MNQVQINPNTPWQKKHLHTLALHYARSPFFRDYFGLFEELYAQEWTHLAPANIRSIELLKKAWGISTRTIRASELEASQDPTQRLIDLCRAVGGKTYLSGPDGAKYMQLERFQEAGIEVIFQQFHHPTYSQLYGDFLSNLSAVDLLFNCGPRGLELIRKEREGCERRACWPSEPTRTISSMAVGER